MLSIEKMVKLIYHAYTSAKSSGYRSAFQSKPFNIPNTKNQNWI